MESLQCTVGPQIPIKSKELLIVVVSDASLHPTLRLATPSPRLCMLIGLVHRMLSLAHFGMIVPYTYRLRCLPNNFLPKYVHLYSSIPRQGPTVVSHFMQARNTGIVLILQRLLCGCQELQMPEFETKKPPHVKQHTQIVSDSVKGFHEMSAGSSCCTYFNSQ